MPACLRCGKEISPDVNFCPNCGVERKPGESAPHEGVPSRLLPKGMLDKNELLVKEHGELVQLWMHEDTLAWNYVQYYIVIMIGLASVIGFLDLNSLNSTIFATILCEAGCILSFAWSFLLNRNRVSNVTYRERATAIERELLDLGCSFDTFLSTADKIRQNIKLRRGQYQPLAWYERGSTLKWARRSMAVLGFLWFFSGFFFLWLSFK